MIPMIPLEFPSDCNAIHNLLAIKKTFHPKIQASCTDVLGLLLLPKTLLLKTIASVLSSTVFGGA